MNNEYEVYRTTTLGLTLQETIDDMIQVYKILKINNFKFHYAPIILHFMLHK